MRQYPNDFDNKECYLEPGELIVWRWLGVDRFFPPRYEESPQTVLRGCSSVSASECELYRVFFDILFTRDEQDYQESGKSSCNFLTSFS